MLKLSIVSIAVDLAIGLKDVMACLEEAKLDIFIGNIQRGNKMFIAGTATGLSRGGSA